MSQRLGANNGDPNWPTNFLYQVHNWSGKWVCKGEWGEVERWPTTPV
jgi:hypothetical protein